MAAMSLAAIGGKYLRQFLVFEHFHSGGKRTLGGAVGLYAAGVKMFKSATTYAAHQYSRHGFAGYGPQRVALTVLMVLIAIIQKFHLSGFNITDGEERRAAEMAVDF